MRSRQRTILFRDTYYGWVIVAVALISMAFWFGIRTSFSVFYVALLEDFPWSRAGSAGIQSMALITYTVLAPIVGGLIDRFGPRRVIGPGILVLTTGLILCSRVNTLSQFYFFYGLIIGVGVTCISIVPYTAILGHWFEKKRGLASGIAVSGMGLGIFMLVPLSQHFIVLWGWRFTFVILGVLVLIVLLPSTWRCSGINLKRSVFYRMGWIRCELPMGRISSKTAKAARRMTGRFRGP